MLRVGIIGLGAVSFSHQRAIEQSQLGKLVAVCDINPTTQEGYKNIPFYLKWKIL